MRWLGYYDSVAHAMAFSSLTAGQKMDLGLYA